MKTLVAVCGMIGFTVIANLLLKTGAVLGRAAGGPWWAQLANWRVVGGFASFAIAALFYTLLLRTAPLNVAQSFAAAQFVATVLAAALILSEPIGAASWIGIALIAAGIAIVGWTRG